MLILSIRRAFCQKPCVHSSTYGATGRVLGFFDRLRSNTVVPRNADCGLPVLWCLGGSSD